MKAMIFAAGLGTRLKPITDTMPKALVSVCGKPLLYHTICKLRDAGYDDIVVNVHHFPEQIRQYIHENDFGVRISISDESGQLLETGGGILKAKQLLLSDEPFLVHNVDIVSNLDLAKLAVQPGDLATLVVSQRDTRRYLLFDDALRLVGWTDTATGEVRSPYPDLNPASCQKFAFSGIHKIAPAVFYAMSTLGFTGRFPIMDFYLKACSSYPIRAYFAEDLRMVDVGKLETLPDAERICAELLKV